MRRRARSVAVLGHSRVLERFGEMFAFLDQVSSETDKLGGLRIDLVDD
jgi:hypothetical protein